MCFLKRRTVRVQMISRRKGQNRTVTNWNPRPSLSKEGKTKVLWSGKGTYKSKQKEEGCLSLWLKSSKGRMLKRLGKIWRKQQRVVKREAFLFCILCPLGSCVLKWIEMYKLFWSSSSIAGPKANGHSSPDFTECWIRLQIQNLLTF